MNKEIKKRWIAALQSGKYKKGSGRLRTNLSQIRAGHENDYSYCCLGVLCDIIKDEVGGSWEMRLFRLSDTPFAATTHLPPEILRLVKLSGTDESELIDINDTSVNFDPVIERIMEID